MGGPGRPRHRALGASGLLRRVWPALLLASISLPASAGDWTITPRITAQEIYTDNVLLTPTNRRSDFITTVAPGLSIPGESPRLQAKVDYAPTLQHYALTPDLNFIGQNLY